MTWAVSYLALLLLWILANCGPMWYIIYKYRRRVLDPKLQEKY